MWGGGDYNAACCRLIPSKIKEKHASNSVIKFFYGLPLIFVSQNRSLHDRNDRNDKKGITMQARL